MLYILRIRKKTFIQSGKRLINFYFYYLYIIYIYFNIYYKIHNTVYSNW